jgi:peroxiredoxin
MMSSSRTQLQSRDIDFTQKSRPFHQGPVMTQSLLPGYAAAAREMVASGVDLANIHALRHGAIQGLWAASGESEQVPLAPDGTGFLTTMKRPSLSDEPIQLDHVRF